MPITARFVVGADGGRSTVRELIGVSMEGTTEPVKWLVVDVEDDQLDAPYSAVYCDPDSPVLMVPLPYGHRRFEFRLRDGEDEQAVVQPDHVRRLLAGRYGTTAAARRRAGQGLPAPLTRGLHVPARDGSCWPATPPTCSRRSSVRA